jgi:hypothetical protein
MIPRSDLLSADSPSGLAVYQLTADRVPSCHIYMEAQVFLPDSRALVVHRSATPHGGDRDDPAHRYLLCHLDDGGSLSPLTEELGATAPAVSPDGEWLYYFVDALHRESPRLTLKRVRLDGSDRETVCENDGHFAGGPERARRVYPLSTIRADGGAIATGGLMGDGRTADPPFGLWVFDIASGAAACVLAGGEWCNLHPQYCRAPDGLAMQDILVQHNHGCEVAADGQQLRSVAGAGADIHVIRDDGTALRDMPWGRDGVEACQGHQRPGRSRRGIAGRATERSQPGFRRAAVLSLRNRPSRHSPGH